MTLWPRWGRSSGKKIQEILSIGILALILLMKGGQIGNRKSRLFIHYISKEYKVSNWLLKKKMKGLRIKTSHFFSPLILFFQMLSLSQFGIICTPLWIPHQPCSGKKKKRERKKKLLCTLFCFATLSPLFGT